MATVTQNDLRIRNAHNMVLHLSSELEPCYMFIGRPSTWDSANEDNPRLRMKVGDESPPYPENNWKDFYKTWDQMISLRKILSREVYHMIPRINWTSGVTYDMYRHDYNETNRSFSGANNLYDCLFYVISRTNNVYVCLDNNLGAQSLIEPLSESNTPFHTSDGYQWLKLYNLNSFQLNEFSTNNFIPIIASNDVTNRGEGSIDTVVIDSRGQDYVPSALFSIYDNEDCYCHITGDGEGAVARVTISDGRIFRIRVVRSGFGYTRAKLDFRPNRVYTSIVDLDNDENGFNPRGNGSFKSTVIIPPPDGWGTPEDFNLNQSFVLARQLGGTRVAVYTKIQRNNDDYIEQSSYRQVGIIDQLEDYIIVDPETDNTIRPDLINVDYAVKVIEPINTLNTDFRIGETIIQIHEHPEDPSIRFTSKGMVTGWNDVTRVIRYIQDPDIHSDLDGKLYKFGGDSVITGEIRGKEVIPDVRFGAGRPEDIEDITFVNGYSRDGVKKYSGNMLYLTNLSPIERITTQTERVSVIISY